MKRILSLIILVCVISACSLQAEVPTPAPTNTPFDSQSDSGQQVVNTATPTLTATHTPTTTPTQQQVIVNNPPTAIPPKPVVVAGPTAIPVITEFTTSVAMVDIEKLKNRNQTVQVSWSVSNRPQNSNLVFEQTLEDGSVYNVELPRDFVTVPSSGSGPLLPYAPQKDSVIRLRVRLVDLNSGVTLDTRQLQVPVIDSTAIDLSASPDPAPAYSDVILNWNVKISGAHHVTLKWFPERWVQSSQGVDLLVNGPIIGSHSLKMGDDQIGGTLVFTLEAYNASSTLLGTRSYALTLKCPAAWAFSDPVRSNEACPTGAAVTTDATYLEFEHGAMVWQSDTDEIHVIYADNTFRTYPDTWNGDAVQMPEAPPEGYYFPQRGFGKVYANNADIRAKLGWALNAEETPYSLKHQRVYAKFKNGTDIGSTYRTLPEGVVLKMGVNLEWNAIGKTPDFGDEGSGLQIISFNVSPTEANLSDTITITWQVKGATKVKVHSITHSYDNLPQTGSLAVPLSSFDDGISPVGIYLYIEDATLDNRIEQRVVNIKSEVKINTFTVNPGVAPSNGEATLSWDITGANSGYISWFPSSYGVAQATLTEFNTAKGSYTVKLPDENRDFTFTLVVPDSSGTQFSKEVTLKTTCPYTYFVSDPTIQADFCPRGNVATLQGAYQRFEHGYMLWIPQGDGTDRIVVFYDNGSAANFGDMWNGEENPVTDTPPNGFIKPERGFGKVWAENQAVRNGLGWATGEEQSYSMQWQRANELSKYSKGYTWVTLPDGHIVRYATDFAGPNTWTQIQ